MTRMETAVRENDLATCDQEPIHVPGGIQPHGLLLAVSGPSFTVTRVSRNVAGYTGRTAAECLGLPLSRLLGDEAVRRLKPALLGAAIEASPLLVGQVNVGPGRPWNAIAHRYGGATILELEPPGETADESVHAVYPPLREFLARLDAVGTVGELARHAVTEVRRITGFDRVLLYRFDEDGHGTVVAEDGNGRLPSYLGQRFPASDIPRQARELYAQNRLRLIVDASYEPVPVEPVDEGPLDLSYSTLRSVSPVHVEYMRNMGTAASMSVSVVRDGRLWGLISCHHAEPRFVSFAVRAACDLLTQVFSFQAANKEHQSAYEDRLMRGQVQARLIASLTAQEDFVTGLAAHADDVLRFADAAGAAVLYEGRCTRMGDAPDEAGVRRLAEWLSTEVRQEVFFTDSLARHAPWAVAVKDRACGLLAVSVSKLHSNYLMWFRPEIHRTVVWAGDPQKPGVASGPGGPTRLHPRTSFAAWREEVRLRSEPWSEGVVDAARGLRNAVVGIVLRKAEELAALTAELERSNQELEAFSYSVSHDLRAPFRHIVGYAELLRSLDLDALGKEGPRYVESIIDSAQFADTLVDNLLSFARMGRTTIHPVHVGMDTLARETVAEVSRDAPGRTIDWRISPLPPAWGDLMMLRQVLVNLFSNAVKYTGPRDRAVIEVTGTGDELETVYTVKDNGIGFDMRYADKLFGVFQRLHRMEDFEGTGIGLANVRRIINRHGGRVWAEGVVGEGATFHFTLPRATSPGPNDHAQADSAGRG